jgi:Tol biopolymer transport system component
VKPIRGGLLLAVASIAAILVIPPVCWATYPGANGRIAYSEGPIVDGDWQIFTISLSAGNPTQLTYKTDTATQARQPSWSADGRRIAFVRSDGTDNNWDVWTMRADGGHQRQVTHDRAFESSPSFSPGGGRIIMVRGFHRDQGAGNIVIVRTDGTERVRLTGGKEARGPAFSPDGRRIVFAGKPRKDRPSGIWVMRRDGTHRRLLANPAHDPAGNGDYEDPDFSPDGSHIVFSSCFDEGHQCPTYNVLMRSTGRHKRVMEGGEEPTFSPDGTRIAASAVTCNTFENCSSRIVSYARNGTGHRAVTHPQAPNDWDRNPSWQPIPGG